MSTELKPTEAPDAEALSDCELDPVVGGQGIDPPIEPDPFDSIPNPEPTHPQPQIPSSGPYDPSPQPRY